ncbi:MAG: DUF4435 domain-containing protein [Ectothiorhodospiraceae bacterium]|nr:DUF4435 domain-containing protein [Ectothiorhodospiraceae bacterium]
MTTYSVEGYLSSVIFHKKTPLLVEGEDDIDVMHTLFNSAIKSKNENEKPQIDSAQIIRDKNLPVGNRKKVEAVYKKAREEGVPIIAWVDREFRRFDISQDTVSDRLRRHYRNEALFWSRGHSIENYFFEPGYFVRFISYRFPRLASHELENEIFSHFHIAIQTAAIISICARQKRLLDRISGLLGHEEWIKIDEKWTLDEGKVLDKLKNRNVREVPATEFLEEYKNFCRKIRENDMRWIIHGHIGWQILWGFCGAVTQELQNNGPSVNQISTGMHKEKILYLARELAERVKTKRTAFPLSFFDCFK